MNGEISSALQRTEKLIGKLQDELTNRERKFDELMEKYGTALKTIIRFQEGLEEILQWSNSEGAQMKKIAKRTLKPPEGTDG